MLFSLLLLIPWTNGYSSGNDPETDGEVSRKILGSSVVTSVSVIMDTANGTQIIDAVGKPVGKLPGAHVASPINLLNPDRYEFFTFDDNGELVKRLMTLEEIQSIIANGDGEDINYNSGTYLPENKVNDVVSNVQSVLKEQILSHKNTSVLKPLFDTPDVTSTWSMILPAIFSNNGDSVGPDKTPNTVTADTIMVETLAEQPQHSTTPSTEKTTLKTTTMTTTTTTAKPTTTITTTTVRPTTTITTTTTSPRPTTTKTTTTTTTAPTTTTAQTTTTKPRTTTAPTTTTKPTTTTAPTTTTKPTTSAPTTTAKPTTTTTSTTSKPTTSPTTFVYEKLSTEQYVGNIKPSTDSVVDIKPTEQEEIKETEASIDKNTPIITVTIISDTKYDTNILPNDTASPIISILPIEEESADILEKISVSTPMPTSVKLTSPISTSTVSTTADFPTSSIPSSASSTTTRNSITTTIATNTTTTLSKSTAVFTTIKPITEQTETERNEMLTTPMELIKIQPYAPLSDPLMPVYSEHNSIPVNDAEIIEITTSKEKQITLPPDIISEMTTIKSELINESNSDIYMSEAVEATTQNTQQSEKAPATESNQQLGNENVEEETDTTESVSEEVNEQESLTNEETNFEASSEIIQTSASASLTNNLKSTTPILLIIQENPSTEKLNLQSDSSEKPILAGSSTEEVADETTSKVSFTTSGEPIVTTPNPIRKTDKPSTIKIIYLTEKTVANILSSTILPSTTTPMTTIPEEITTISKLITTEKPNIVKVVPLTEKLITTISSISSSTENPAFTKNANDKTEQEESTLSLNKDEEEDATGQPVFDVTTATEDGIYNKAVTESLNLLLSSTNIYEINTQLAGLTTPMDAETVIYATELNENENEKLETDQTTQIYSTQNSLMSSIQELISQTMNDADIEEQIINLNANKKVEGILSNIDAKPMLNIQHEAATAGSTLMDNSGLEIEENTEGETLDTSSTESDENIKLSEAMNSVLSQIFSQNAGDTIDDATMVEKVVDHSGLSSELPEIVEITTEAAYDTVVLIKNEGETRKNETSEENITAESSQKIITEIDNNNDLKDSDAGEATVSNNDDIAPELEKNTTSHFEILQSDANLPQNDNTDTIELTTITIDIERNVTGEYPSTIKEDKEEDLIKYETIPLVFGQKIKTQSPENITEPSIVTSTENVVTTKTQKIQTPEEYELKENYKEMNVLNVTVNEEQTTLSSISTSTVIITDTFNNQSDKSNELQPVKKIKVDDALDTIPVKPAPSDMKSSMSELPMKEVTHTLLSSSLPPKITTPIPISENKNVPALNKNTEELKNTSWTLVSTIHPHTSANPTPETKPIIPSMPTIVSVKLSQQNLPGFGLEATTTKLDTDIYQFVELCNELSFGFWNAVNNGISSARSVFVSPFAATSLLAMVFLGARGATSGEMNEILKLDDMVTFNPHLIFKNVSESIEVSKSTGVAVSVIARELYSDRSRGKLLSFYKERARQFYDGHVEEINFREVGDVVRRRTNLIVKKYTSGKISEYLKDNTVTMRPPLAGISASIFQTDCSSAYTDGRDGELHFVVLPSIRQRRLVPIPAVVFRTGFLAGYDPTLDATAAAIGTQEQIISTILIIPGQQGIAAPGDGLARLEKQLSETAFKKGAWTRLLRALIPRPGLELQIPRFSHKSVINATVALKRMGLKDLFTYDKADLRGLNGVAHELHLSDILQLNNFATCGETPINTEQHHSEIYPATSRRPYRRTKKLGHYISDSPFGDFTIVGDEPRDYQRAFHDPLHDPNLLALPLPLRPRQARIPDAPRLRFDRPFLFYVRHNPTGLILHMGRFNPRLLP